MYKIIGADQKEYGPISVEQIRLWIQEGRLNAASRIQVDGTGDWKLVRDMPEFASLLPPAPAPITFPTTPPVPASNVMARWALGVGIASIPCFCCMILGPVSIGLGVLALSQIKQNPNQEGRGMAVAGIVLGSISLLFTLLSYLINIFSPGIFQNLQNSFPH
jgi:Domain of unknown function (DUF4190)/GYF domain 2